MIFQRPERFGKNIHSLCIEKDVINSDKIISEIMINNIILNLDILYSIIH